MPTYAMSSVGKTQTKRIFFWFVGIFFGFFNISLTYFRVFFGHFGLGFPWQPWQCLAPITLYWKPGNVRPLLPYTGTLAMSGPYYLILERLDEAGRHLVILEVL